MKYKTMLLCGLFFAAQPVLSQQKPNVILIMADDLGYEAIPSYGNEENITPHLDQMVAEGMRFENCHSTPLCTPSRVQIMTGKYNFRNYVGFGILDPGETTFGHLMKQAGYATCITGKWQLFGNEGQRKLAGGKKGTLPEDAGFDHYRLWQIKELGSRYKNPLLDTKETGLETYEGAYGPDLFVDYLEEFMENNVENPFFAYFPMVLTHDPFEPTPNSTEFEQYDPKERINDPKYFPQMVQYMDHLVGRIVKKVTDLGISENTLIIFIGDNGTDRDVHSRANGQVLKGNKGFTNDLGTHVPMIAYWPGKIPAGSINSNLIDFTDFVPTLLEAAGTQPQDHSNKWDGISFYDQLLGEKHPKNAREWIFCHYDPNWGKFEPRRFIYNTDWKLYENG
ncbi:MAG: sulfatase-like hydrolase/transferase, partial [Cyclobacteriaceae bacterium]